MSRTTLHSLAEIPLGEDVRIRALLQDIAHQRDNLVGQAEQVRSAISGVQIDLRHDIALISDAGTPAISDPGFRLAREAVKEGIRVVPVPGPSAVTAAPCAGGLPTHRFLFLGFSPPKKEAARKRLASVPASQASCLMRRWTPRPGFPR